MAIFAESIGNLIIGFFTLEIAGNYLIEYIWVIAAFIIAMLAVKVFKVVILRKLRQIVEKTHNDFDELLIDIIDHIGLPFYLVIALYASLQFVELPAQFTEYLHYLLIITVVFYSIRGMQKIAIYWFKKGSGKGSSQGLTRLFENVIKIALWSIALILILQNMGYRIDALIASMGIAGVAVAFALQKVLEDIFSAFSIYFDKPFEVGDFIILGDDMGIVKDIGLKSTRLQTLHGQELIVSNRELTTTRINNYKKMKKRRIVFSFGVTYDTPVKKVSKIPGIVKKIIKDVENTDPDRIHFKSFGDYSLIFEVVYYMLVPEYNKYMDAQQEINLKLMKAFEKEGIEFAFPTQTLYVNKLT